MTTYDRTTFEQQLVHACWLVADRRTTVIRYRNGFILVWLGLCVLACAKDALAQQSNPPAPTPYPPSLAINRPPAGSSAPTTATRVVVCEGGQKPWWESFPWTALTVVAGFVGIIIQGRIQHRDKLKQQADDKAQDLRMEIYRDITEQCRKIGDADSYRTMLWNLRYQLEETGQGCGQPSLRAIKFSEEHSHYRRQVNELYFVLERWAIALPGFEMTRMALFAANEDEAKSFQNLYLALLKVLPFGEEGTPQFMAARPTTKAQRDDLEKLVNKFQDDAMTLYTYVNDIETEAQNFLLGPLFPNHRRERRKPPDPDVIVLVTEPPEAVAALEAHFKSTSSWGVATKNAKVAADAKAAAKKAADGYDRT